MATDWNRIRQHRWSGEYCSRSGCFPEAGEEDDGDAEDVAVDSEFIVYANDQDDRGHRPDEDDPSLPACHVDRGNEEEANQEDGVVEDDIEAEEDADDAAEGDDVEGEEVEDGDGNEDDGNDS